MMALCPIGRREARAYVLLHHRHHGWPTGFLWLHGLHDDAGDLVGVAVVGRPSARQLDNGLTCEVTRLCTHGARHACSMLYGAARRAADAKGYRRGLTYILASEWDRFDDEGRRIGGRSVLAAGYRFLWRTRGGSWSRPSRRREDRAPTEPKVAFGWGMWPGPSELGVEAPEGVAA